MAEPTGHCPYLGLKQNRAIRFASPTSEHRCYVSGEPLDIPVDQSEFCLSQGHVHCPLYMGLTVPTTSDAAAIAGGLAVVPAAGMRGWYTTLSPRDRTVYAIMLAMLAIIVAIYLFVGLQSFLARGNTEQNAGVPTAAPATQQLAIGQDRTANAASPIPPTPTDLPTNTPVPAPTNEPTQAPLFLAPTQPATVAPAATSAPIASPIAVPSSTGVAQAATTSAPKPTNAPPTSAPAATSAPKPTNAPPTSAPAATSAPKPTNAPKPTITKPTDMPQVVTAIKPVVLYFQDATGSLLVPVRRNITVENNRIAESAIRELIAGPRNGLGRLVRADAKLLGITIDNKLATANFDRDPGGLESIVFTLTEFPTVSQVQIQVNGANLGGARARPVLNPINPEKLAQNYSTTEFLPLYFPAAKGNYDIRLIRMVPKTKQTAEATMRALLQGPGAYNGAARRVIPENTELRGIKINKGVVLVDFTQAFANAAELDAAMRTVVESLTTLPNISGVQFLVEGQAFADGKVFGKPAINQE